MLYVLKRGYPWRIMKAGALESFRLDKDNLTKVENVLVDGD